MVIYACTKQICADNNGLSFTISAALMCTAALYEPSSAAVKIVFIIGIENMFEGFKNSF